MTKNQKAQSGDQSSAGFSVIDPEPEVPISTEIPGQHVQALYDDYALMLYEENMLRGIQEQLQHVQLRYFTDEEFHVKLTKQEFYQILEDEYDVIAQDLMLTIHVIFERGLVRFSVSSNSENDENSRVSVDIHAESSEAGDQIWEEIKALFHEYFAQVDDFVEISWAFFDGTRMRQAHIIEHVEETIHDEAYPFLEDGLKSYVDAYLKSDEQVLLLKGVAGTGKSRFIRYIMRHLTLQKNRWISVLFTNEQRVLQTDSFYLGFIQDDYGLMVLEDIDSELSKRSAGNQVMAKLLGVSDGIIQSFSQEKKIILSTNLQTVESQVDEALLRPGRCYDVLDFRKLTYEESLRLYQKLSETNDPTYFAEYHSRDARYTLGDVYRFHKQPERGKKNLKKRKSGFNKVGFNK